MEEKRITLVAKYVNVASAIAMGRGKSSSRQIIGHEDIKKKNMKVIRGESG